VLIVVVSGLLTVVALLLIGETKDRNVAESAPTNMH
jgi:hypothetical protein